MKTPLRGTGMVVSVAAAALSFIAPNASDVQFYVIAKNQKYEQADAGQPNQLNVGNPFRITAELGATASSSVVSATIEAAGGSPFALMYDLLNDIFIIQFKFSTQASLDSSAPPGKYTFRVNTAHDGAHIMTLPLPASTYTSPPHISNFTPLQTVNPTADCNLTWDPLPGGSTADYVYMKLNDTVTGASVFQTGNPADPRALNGKSTSLAIPANLLAAGQQYIAEIGYFKILSKDTTSLPGATGIAAYGSFTDFTLQTVANPVLFIFSLRHIVNGGTFNSTGLSSPILPAEIDGYRANLNVRKDALNSYPAPNTVLFTGPPGSGLTNAPGDANASGVSSNQANYFSSRPSPHIGPGGTWNVNYKGVPQNFTIPAPESTNRLVIPVPIFTFAVDGTLRTVRWSYFDSKGTPLAKAPAFLTSIRLQLQDATRFVYDSGGLAPTITEHNLGSPVTWTAVQTARFLSDDTLGNSYLVIFQRTTPPAPAQLSALNWSAQTGFSLRLNGSPGTSYTVESSSDLSHWTSLLITNLPFSSIDLLDAQTTTNRHLFYRAKAGN